MTSAVGDLTLDDAICTLIDHQIAEYLAATLATDPTDVNVVNLFAGAVAGVVRFAWRFAKPGVTREAVEVSIIDSVKHFVAEAAKSGGPGCLAIMEAGGHG